MGVHWCLQIRIFNPRKGTVSRVPRSRILEEGDVILYPKSMLGSGSEQMLLAAPSKTNVKGSREESERRMESGAKKAGNHRLNPAGWLDQLNPEDPGGAGQGNHSVTPTVRSPATSSASTSSSPRRSALPPPLRVLCRTDDIVFINKPAGVSVQGPDGDSVEALMGSLRTTPSDDLK